MPKLDPKPVRCDLTNTECVKLIGGLLSSLCEQTSIETVKEAIDWWSQAKSPWQAFHTMKAYYLAHPDVDILLGFDPKEGIEVDGTGG